MVPPTQTEPMIPTKPVAACSYENSLALALFFVLGCFAVVFALRLMSSQGLTSTQPQLLRNQVSLAPEIDTEWRRTKDGWENTLKWNPGISYRPNLVFESLHPFVFTGLLLFASLIVLIIGSGERDVTRLIQTVKNKNWELD